MVFTPSLSVHKATTKKNEMILGTKRYHAPGSVESEKDHTHATNITDMALAIIQPTTGVWREVRKKKGKRGKLDDFYNYTSH